VRSVSTMGDEVGSASFDGKVRSEIIGGFALIALLLMAIGLHGLIAGDIATRWREFGVRLAMGATNGSIRGQVLGKTAGLLLAGCAAGGLAVFATSRLIEASLEGMAPVHASTALAVLLAVALAAGSAILWPLRRLARIDPATALRHE
jgi:putative ABC transport system permease protein